MKEYTEKEYRDAFGDQAWADKVLPVKENGNVESVWATNSGNVFMIIMEEERV